MTDKERKLLIELALTISQMQPTYSKYFQQLIDDIALESIALENARDIDICPTGMDEYGSLG